MIHQYFAEQTNLQLTYEKIKADDTSFERQVSDIFTQGGKGLNVTLPFKQRAFAMAQIRSTRCQLAGSANTLWMKGDKLHADNTDGVGLIRDLAHLIELQGKRILLLGAGGAARGIINPLLEANPSCLVLANRRLEKAQELQAVFPQIRCSALDKVTGVYDLVINATSASLEGESIVLPAECLSQKPLCYDLTYNKQAPTAFVLYAKGYGCNAVDGLGMLVEQAAESFFIWHRVMPSTTPVLNLLRED